MSTETNADTRQYYHGPSYKELGPYGQQIEKAVISLERLNGATRLSYSVEKTPEPWNYGHFNDVFIEGESGLTTHLKRDGNTTIEGNLYGAGGTQKVRNNFFKNLCPTLPKFTRVTLLDKTANIVSTRIAYIDWKS